MILDTPPTVFSLRDILTVASTLITSSLFYGGVKFFLRGRKADAGAIIIKSAEGVVVLQSKIIQELRDENLNLKMELQTLKDQLEDVDKKLEICSEHIARLEKNNNGD